jgi:hypothetical protein
MIIFKKVQSRLISESALKYITYHSKKSLFNFNFNKEKTQESIKEGKEDTQPKENKKTEKSILDIEESAKYVEEKVK